MRKIKVFNNERLLYENFHVCKWKNASIKIERLYDVYVFIYVEEGSALMHVTVWERLMDVYETW